MFNRIDLSKQRVRLKVSSCRTPKNNVPGLFWERFGRLLNQRNNHIVFGGCSSRQERWKSPGVGLALIPTHIPGHQGRVFEGGTGLNEKGYPGMDSHQEKFSTLGNDIERPLFMAGIPGRFCPD